MPTPTFTPTPNREAVALIAGRKPVAAKVFYGLLPELRARAFTVTGIEGANVLQRVRDAIAALPQGIGDDGQAYTWDTQKQIIANELEASNFSKEAAQTRAQIILRVNAFQAFSSTIWNLAQQDQDTTHLQYIHGDQAKDPTPSHVALDGVILPKDDPFWRTHTGPWGHLGCVCYVRPMNEDLVNEARDKDQAQTNPEARNVLEGPAADQLRNGTLMRDGRRYDVSPPEGDNAFKWHPDDLRLPLAQVLARYDPSVQTAFESWARKTDTGDGTTVWNWLNGAELKAQPLPPPAEKQSPPTPVAPAAAKHAPSPQPLNPSPIDSATSDLKSKSGATNVLYKAPHSAKKFGAQIKSESGRIAHATVMANLYAEMRQRFPNMPANPTHTVIVTASKRGAATLDGPTPFLSIKAKEFTAADWTAIDAWETSHGRRWGVERRGTQVADNFRHELAHNLSTPEIIREWDAVISQHNLEWFRQNVSEYAARDLKRYEALAETFSLCTRAEYQRNALPKVVEDFIFKRMLGET